MSVVADCPAASALTTAALYDLVAPSYQRWWAPVILPATLRVLDLVEPAIADRPDAVLVDLGAGTGPLARAAVERWSQVRAVAVDPSGGMLELGQDEAASTLPRAARRRVQWINGVAERLPMADGSVDAVVSSFTLQYLRPRVAALREAHRVCRPRAAIAVVTWLAGDWPFAPWELLESTIDELGISRPASGEGGGFRSLGSAAALVRRAGFHSVRAAADFVEYQWTIEPLVRCTVEEEQRPLFESLDKDTAHRLVELWRERLHDLSAADLLYRQGVAYVSGRC
jgi:ubiquinone/menaquinone biosynthesis C-methylase UbiE